MDDSFSPELNEATRIIDVPGMTVMWAACRSKKGECCGVGYFIGPTTKRTRPMQEGRYW